MLYRLRRPWTVDQGQKPLCGPATILFNLLMKQPLTYISIMKNLWENGYFFTTKSKNRITASDSIKNNSTVENRQGMQAADWIFSSVLRDTTSTIFHLDPAARDTMLNIQGMTTPWEMVGWMKELFPNYNVNFDWTIIDSDVDGLKKAALNLKKPTGINAMMVNASGLLNNKTPSLSTPEHWVGLYNTEIVEKDNHISFNIFTWGKIYKINAKKADLNSYIFGYGNGYS